MLHIAKYNAEVRESFASREKSKVTGIISNLAAISIENKVNQRLPEMRRSREKKIGAGYVMHISQEESDFK